VLPASRTVNWICAPSILEVVLFCTSPTAYRVVREPRVRVKNDPFDTTTTRPVGVRVGVTVGVWVRVGVLVAVPVHVGVLVAVAVELGVLVGGVPVGELVGVDGELVTVGVWVPVGLDVGDAVPVAVGLGVGETVSFGVVVRVGVRVVVGVEVGGSMPIASLSRMTIGRETSQYGLQMGVG